MKPPARQTERRRTVAALLRAGEQAADERRQIAAEKAEGKKAQRERAAARASAKQLGQLAGKEPVLWGRVESLVANKQPKSYDRAVELLADLRDLAARKDEIGFQRGRSRRCAPRMQGSDRPLGQSRTVTAQGATIDEAACHPRRGRKADPQARARDPRPTDSAIVEAAHVCEPQTGLVSSRTRGKGLRRLPRRPGGGMPPTPI
jgi:hypothetical protein